MPSYEAVVAGYQKLRNDKKALQDQHKEELAPYNEAMRKMEAWLLREMTEQGAENIKTSTGTAYISAPLKASIQDWGEFLAYVQKESLWAMMEQRVSDTAVEEFMESTGDVPPGVKVTRTRFVRIRK